MLKNTAALEQHDKLTNEQRINYIIKKYDSFLHAKLAPTRRINPNQPPQDPQLRAAWEETWLIDKALQRKQNSSKRMVSRVNETISENRVEPNDQLTKSVFDPSDDILNKRTFVIRENYEKNLPAITEVTFNSDINVFDTHDREVGMACFTLFESGNRYASAEQIYRVMTGNTKARLYAKEEARIKKSLERLIKTTIRADMSGIYPMNYQESAPELFASILPAKFVTEIRVNGSKSTVVQFLDESPLVTIARFKNNQRLTYPLESPCINERLSSDRIALANYARRYIEECRIQSQPTHTIIFDTLFEKNGLSGKSKTEKKRYRDFLNRCFELWKENGCINDYKFIISSGRSHGYYGITFDI